jgi:hypothetical protein
MNHQRLFGALWVTELIVGLLPAFVTLCAGFFSYALVVPVLLPHLLTSSPDGFVALRTFLLLSGVVIGGILGLTGIWLALRPERLHRSPLLKYAAILFSCAGLLAEGLYAATEGTREITSNVFPLWVVLGPLIVGIHCFYRVFSKPARTRSPTAPSQP